MLTLITLMVVWQMFIGLVVSYPGSTFVTTDSTTGEWKINTAPSITYGSGVATNAHLTFEDASNLGKNTHLDLLQIIGQ